MSSFVNQSAAAALIAFGLTGSLASSSFAQDAAKPAFTPHCTGLICDAYYAGIPAGEPSPSSLPCRDFICGFFGGRTPEQPVAAAEPVPAAPEPKAAPVKVKKKRVARAAPKPADTTTKAAATKAAAPKPIEAAAQ